MRTEDRTAWARDLRLVAGVLFPVLGTIGIILISDKSSSAALLSFFCLIISPRLLSKALESRAKAIVVILACVAVGYLLATWLEANGYSV
jgi:ABC-type spermidine/putrescine transport system permease subunit I